VAAFAWAGDRPGVTDGRQGAADRSDGASEALLGGGAPAGVLRLVAVSTLRVHPDAALVPVPGREDWQRLLASVAGYGLEEPLSVTAEGILLDGRQRLRAARELSFSHVRVRVVSPADERAFILRAALVRRQLEQGQRAALALLLGEHEQASVAARARSTANLRRGARPAEVAALPPRGGRTRDRLGEEWGVSGRLIQDVKLVRKADPGLFEQVLAGTLAPGKALRRLRQRELAVTLDPSPVMPVGPFEVVLADPPWRLGGDPESARAPENHYSTMPLEQITALDVPAADDAVLFLWTPACLLPQALQVMEAWGFVFRAELVWVKPSKGLGHYLRYRHEPLLIGTRGRLPCPEPALRPDSVLEAARGRHSQKPVELYELIERMHPQASKLELFARKARPGWAAYGNEVDPR
jgi:N6-adenosine-specific RNA methylase IME4/ParB-like chromosome segregation protein Spo0J